ncbi:MAG TPA: ATP-binding protein [Ohtaekwangia sp.]
MQNQRNNTISVKRKIITGFFLALVAIILAFGITHLSFRKMLETVDQLSDPNQKLSVLNKVFEGITTLDQQQRAEAIRNPRKSYSSFLSQSEAVNVMIDSLLNMPWDSTQYQRLSTMKKILQNRNKLFFSYLKLKSRVSDNQKFSDRLDTVSTIIEQSQVDTSVVSTQKKTVTTYWTDSTETKDDRSFISRLFGKKKSETNPESHVKVQEELSVVVDTLAFARTSEALAEVERIMHDLENDQRFRNNELQQRELELIHANSLFINQLLGILHDVENEELLRMRVNNQRAGDLFNRSLSDISFLFLGFVLIAAVLIYLIWIDITKSNYYKEQLERARDEAEELSQVKQRFLANMSHEIRTPLQSILGFAEQLKFTSGRNSEAADAIYSSSEHLLHIVNEVLDYSRLSSGNFTLAQEPFALYDLIDEIDAAIRVQAEKKKLSFLLDITAAEDINLIGDSFRIRQILYNLLGNAVKFTPKGFVRLTVKTEEEENNSIALTFEITDTGIGIKPEDLKKIFNQFEQASALIAQHYGGGSGLGLTIAKSLIEAQDGSLDVTSETGIGSTFTVYLHLQKTGEIKPLPASVSTPPRLTKRHGKILIVDDDTMILRLCSLILSKHEVEHETFSESEKLLSRSVDTAVTHILMDIRMPRINGIELRQALEQKYSRSVRYIALTAHVFQQERQQLIDEGFDIVLSKPFREHELLQVIDIDDHDAESNLPETDFTALREMTLGDEQLFQSVITQFVDETEKDLENLEVNINQMNTKAIREIVHKLAGRVGQIGANPLSLKLRTMEERLNQGENLQYLIERLLGLRDEINSLLLTARIAVVQ